VTTPPFTRGQATYPEDDDSSFYLMVLERGEWFRISSEYYKSSAHFLDALSLSPLCTANIAPNTLMWYKTRHLLGSDDRGTNFVATSIIRSLYPETRDAQHEAVDFAVFTAIEPDAGPLSAPPPLAEADEATVAAFCSLGRRLININMPQITEDSTK
jgi:hypothetical protein